MTRRAIAVAAITVCLVPLTGSAAPAGEKAAWTQWGGPTQEFRAEGGELAASWPEGGPARKWSRELGDGYSSILYEDGRLYTMYREEGQEVVVALDAANGKTIWEHRYAASPAEGHVTQFGEGPRSTPLIVGDRIFAIGVSARMHALNKKDGSKLWEHDLWKEFGGNVLQHGYASSPIAHGNTIITLVGGEGASIVAFDAETGKVAWKAQSYKNSYSTPRLLDVDGELQLVAFMAEGVVGLDPANGELKWMFGHQNSFGPGQNISLPMMSDANHMLISSPEAGAKGLELTRDGKATRVKELWSTRKIQFYHVTTVRDGDWVYGSTGTGSPAFMAAINIETGEIAWRERGFAKANVVAAGGRMIVLDEDGNLALTTATPKGLEVHSRVGLLDGVAWTVPTIVGKTMYLRDKNRILAVNLG